MATRGQDTVKAVTLGDMLGRIGTMVRFHRKNAGFSQAAFAELAGVGKTVVFDVEKGKQTVQVDSLFKILSTLNITVEFTSPLMARFREEHGDA